MAFPSDGNHPERNFPDPLHGLIQTPDEPSAPASSRASRHWDQDGSMVACSPDSPQCGCTGTHFHPPDLNRLGLSPRGAPQRDQYSRQAAQENGSRERLMIRCKEVTAMMGPDLTDPKNRARNKKSSTLVTKYSGPLTFLPTIVPDSSHHSSSLLTPGTSGFPPISSDESVKHRKQGKSGKRARKSSSNSKRRRTPPTALANTGNSLPKLAASTGGVPYPRTDSKVFKVDRLQPIHTTGTSTSAHRTIRGSKKSPHKRRKSSKTTT
ncbi:uncharacterized protein [Branchiostoma lanceolatum]|uniref:uncharacterized protein n=1 Tax=Branchiostoma lanceolatum TaxID=7740 RepID=UPI003452181B